MQDVNSLRDFYEVNLELAMPGAPISFYEVEEGIVSSGQVLPPALISNCEIEDALIGEGSVLRVSPFPLLLWVRCNESTTRNVALQSGSAASLARITLCLISYLGGEHMPMRILCGWDQSHVFSAPLI